MPHTDKINPQTQQIQQTTVDQFQNDFVSAAENISLPVFVVVLAAA